MRGGSGSGGDGDDGGSGSGRSLHLELELQTDTGVNTLRRTPSNEYFLTPSSGIAWRWFYGTFIY